MENTIETSTFDVLMEGTMYGAQIDSVLMEAETAKPVVKNFESFNAALEPVKAAAIKVNVAKANRANNTWLGVIEKVNNAKPAATPEAEAKRVAKELKVIAAGFGKALSEYSAVKPEGDDKKVEEVKALKAAVAVAKKELTLMQRAMVYVNKALAQITKVAKTVIGMDTGISNWKAIATTVGMIIGGYSVGYGILKTISGVATGSFLAIKSNISTMYKVAKDPKKYGAKSFIFGALLGTVLVGFARLAVTVGKVMKLLFDKAGKAIKDKKKLS